MLYPSTRASIENTASKQLFVLVRDTVIRWQLLATLEESPFWDTEFSPDSQRILTKQDSTARLWNAANGQLLVVLQRRLAVYPSVVFSPDSQRILTVGADNVAQVLRIVTLSDIADLLAK